jgi:chemotaxis protein methyltransferase CheR
MSEIELRSEEFSLFRGYIYTKVGIALSDQKSPLIKGRLNKRLHELKLHSFGAYYDYLVNDFSGEELSYFISAISTNVTSFFREEAQWKWLEGYLPTLIEAKEDKKIRIWSAGCSSGEEPYTILMFLQHYLSDFETWDIKILATDISTKVLSVAIRGSYDAKQVSELPKAIALSAFEKEHSSGEIRYRIIDSLREKVLFRLYNLVTDPFFFKNRFDMIFCRNVMIYFDEETRYQVVERFEKVLLEGAPLFLGSSESLVANHHRFKQAGASIYLKSHSN